MQLHYSQYKRKHCKTGTIIYKQNIHILLPEITSLSKLWEKKHTVPQCQLPTIHWTHILRDLAEVWRCNEWALCSLEGAQMVLVQAWCWQTEKIWKVHITNYTSVINNIDVWNKKNYRVLHFTCSWQPYSYWCTGSWF